MVDFPTPPLEFAIAIIIAIWIERKPAFWQAVISRSPASSRDGHHTVWSSINVVTPAVEQAIWLAGEQPCYLGC